MSYSTDLGLEHKFARIDVAKPLDDAMQIEGYASFFGKPDQGKDIVETGAYTKSLGKLATEGRSVKMLWQHDATQPIGVWDEVREDDRGLFVKGRLLPGVPRAAEAASLLSAGAIDGLSIGYRTVQAAKDGQGRRLLQELDLWEVSLVTFPMLPEARVGAKGDTPLDATLREIAGVFEDARAQLADH